LLQATPMVPAASRIKEYFINFIQLAFYD